MKKKYFKSLFLFIDILLDISSTFKAAAKELIKIETI